MNESTTLLVKEGHDLSEDELKQCNEAIYREFNVQPLSKNELEGRLFFLLKSNEQLLAMGALWEVFPVIFDKEIFAINAFLNVVANSKSKGYGKQVVVAMREYLAARNKTAFGFTMPKNIGFYEKCGFASDTSSTKRFVYMKDGKSIINQDGQYIFYQDSSDGFMKKVLDHPEKDVSIPTDQLW